MISDPYFAALAVGVGGLATMALTGLAAHGHGGAHASHSGHSAGGHGSSPSGHTGGSHSAPHSPHHHHGTGGNSPLALALLLWVSPRVLFGACTGFGACGLLLEHAGLPTGTSLVAAIVGATLFEWKVMQPAWRFLLGFASRPARTLEHSLFGEATAVTPFDDRGCGLVRLDVDGEVRQVLATVAQTDPGAQAFRIRAGERLRVVEVDTLRGRCTVSRAR